MSQPVTNTRLSLIGRLNNPQDHLAWSEFTSLYEPLLLRMFRSQGLQDADARDVCQQVLQAVARDVEQWQPDGKEQSFRRWLFQVARNRTLKFLESQRRQPRSGGAAVSSNPSQPDRGTNAGANLEQVPDPRESLSDFFEREFRQQLLVQSAEHIRGEFRESTWQAFWKTCVEGQSIPEVAKELGISVGSVYVARSRITARLKSEIQRTLAEQDVADGKGS